LTEIHTEWFTSILPSEESRRDYMEKREFYLWGAVERHCSDKDIDSLEMACREIRATRRKREQLGEA